MYTKKISVRLFGCFPFRHSVRKYSTFFHTSLRFVGASACVKLQRYEEAIAWCDKGLAVSFHN